MSQQATPEGNVERQATPVTVTPAPQPSSPTQEMFPASYVQELRQENAKHRTAAKEHLAEVERLKAFEGETTKLKAEVRGFKVNGAVAEAITKLGGNVKLTQALIRDEVAALDIDAKDFGKSLAALVEKTIADNPELKAVAAAGRPAAPARAGSDITHPNTSPVQDGQWTEAELAQARKDGRHEDIQKALSEGKLSAIMANRGAR